MLSTKCLQIINLIYTYNEDLALNNRQCLICHKTWRCPWCNGYRFRKWTRRHEFKSWTRLLLEKQGRVRRTRHAGHCWRSRDELIRDVLLWTPTHGRAKAGRPARTYIQQLCENTGCCPEDLPRAMNDREEWRERVRDIRATSAIWWWWWLLGKDWWYG